ncbi:aminotransferase class I/II-fold pyridoxal phosphate-dependent enzyme [Sulfurimonas sp.]
MNYYTNELKALQRSGRYRTREVLDYSLKDFASNDYLGLSHKKELHRKTCLELELNAVHSSKASMLVNGYHQIHKDFEDALCEANNFEAGIVLGSGFNANIALIEALLRKGDTLFIDELYHASGMLASQISSINVIIFRHNDMNHLEELLSKSHAKRSVIAVEGIYSMDGDLCPKEVFSLADKYEAILIVDEAHSSGVIGKTLMGVFDFYDIKVKDNYIKMGTLGKAYGSFGAFILSSKHISEYLLNRAKPIIYATSLSLYDTLLAHNSLKYIVSNVQSLQEDIKKRQQIVYEKLDIKVDGLIVPIVFGDNEKVLEIKDELLTLGYAVGGIRQPTVDKAIIRLIARLGEKSEDLENVCQILADIKK